MFRYSDDDTSESYHLDGKVDKRTIYNRQRHLMALQRKIQDHRGHTQREIGNTAAVTPTDRRRLPIVPDGTSMTLDEDERMPKGGRVL